MRTTTLLAIAAIAAIAGAVGYQSGFEYATLLYYGLMGIGVTTLVYLFLKNRTAASV